MHPGKMQAVVDRPQLQLSVVVTDEEGLTNPQFPKGSALFPPRPSKHMAEANLGLEKSPPLRLQQTGGGSAGEQQNEARGQLLPIRAGPGHNRDGGAQPGHEGAPPAARNRGRACAPSVLGEPCPPPCATLHYKARQGERNAPPSPPRLGDLPSPTPAHGLPRRRPRPRSLPALTRLPRPRT